MFGCRLSWHILISDSIHFEVPEKPYVLVILSQSDLKHVLIQPPFLPPLILLILNSVLPDSLNRLQRYTDKWPREIAECLQLILVVAEGPRGELEPPRDEVRLETRLETGQL